ncbi:MAG: hypothetical protein R2727_06350 [Bacteroidales bacterium]
MAGIFIFAGTAVRIPRTVYHFLETFVGVRWLTPDAEIVPAIRRPAIRIPLDYTYIPDITTRTVHSRLFYDNPQFATRMRVTTRGLSGLCPGCQGTYISPFYT